VLSSFFVLDYSSLSSICWNEDRIDPRFSEYSRRARFDIPPG
jgi:hypothetical protein